MCVSYVLIYIIYMFNLTFNYIRKFKYLFSFVRSLCPPVPTYSRFQMSWKRFYFIYLFISVLSVLFSIVFSIYTYEKLVLISCHGINISFWFIFLFLFLDMRIIYVCAFYLLKLVWPGLVWSGLLLILTIFF